MIAGLLLISVIANLLLYYRVKNWEMKFVQKLASNDFFEEDEVNVHLERKGETIGVSVSSPKLNFLVQHTIKEDKTQPFLNRQSKKTEHENK